MSSDLLCAAGVTVGAVMQNEIIYILNATVDCIICMLLFVALVSGFITFDMG
jgi:hypothetical protein